MSAKEQLSALLATRQAGEAGSVASIQQASEHFAADSTLIPSSYGELSKKNRNVAITNYGGFITHKFGIQPSAVYALGDVIAAKHTSLDGKWDMDKDAFIGVLNSIKAEYDYEVAEATAKSSALGKDGEKKAKTLVANTDALVSVAVVTPQTLDDAKSVYRRLGAFIALQEGNKSPLVAITEPELISA